MPRHAGVATSSRFLRPSRQRKQRSLSPNASAPGLPKKAHRGRRRDGPDRSRRAGMIHLRVECYAGHRGEQTPRMLQIDERQVYVQEVLDAWLAPDHRYFKLKGEDGDTYIIR